MMVEDIESDEKWLLSNYRESWKTSFEQAGYIVVNNLIDDDLVRKYQEIYERLMKNKATSCHRNDLGSHLEPAVKGLENICQIMWPSVYETCLLEGHVFKRLLSVVKRILGEDMAFDFDMLINKLPNSNTATPWHQDESYWPNMLDKRAVSCWVSLDNATIDNGCMWFVKGSHREPTLRPHHPAKVGHHVRCTDRCSEEEGSPVPLSPGSCTLHHGRTLHYTRGNKTSSQRRAYILNFRPSAMVQWERENGFDHSKTTKF